MSYDVYKAAVMRALPAAPEVPLEAPPAESFDLQTLVCPGCGCPDAAVQQVEDAEVAKCPKCQCEFSPQMESVSRKVIRRISEHRQRRLERFMERLPVSPPVPRLDPVDYTLFRKIVDGASREKRFVPNQQNIAHALEQIKARFVQERTDGYVDRHGVHHPPVTREEAEQRWAAAAPMFAQQIQSPDERVAQRLSLGTHREEFAFA